MGSGYRLLGRRRVGPGEGNLVGPGGKIEPGEPAEQAIVREVYEVTSLVLGRVELVGELTCSFPFAPNWSQKSWVSSAAIGLGLRENPRNRLPTGTR